MGTNTDIGFINNSNSDITGAHTISYHGIIRQLNPAVIPRMTAIANMG